MYWYWCTTTYQPAPCCYGMSDDKLGWWFIRHLHSNTHTFRLARRIREPRLCCRAKLAEGNAAAALEEMRPLFTRSRAVFSINMEEISAGSDAKARLLLLADWEGRGRHCHCIDGVMFRSHVCRQQMLLDIDGTCSRPWLCTDVGLLLRRSTAHWPRAGGSGGCRCRPTPAAAAPRPRSCGAIARPRSQVRWVSLLQAIPPVADACGERNIGDPERPSTMRVSIDLSRAHYAGREVHYEPFVANCSCRDARH